MKNAIIFLVVLCVHEINVHDVHAQLEQLPLVEEAARLISPGWDEWPLHVRKERTIEEARQSMGLEDPFSDEFFQQVAVYFESDERSGLIVGRLLNLIRLLGDDRAVPALKRLRESDSYHSLAAFYLLAELASNDPMIDERIAHSVERVLEGPPYHYGILQPKMLHYQRANLAIENAQKLSDFADSELERIGTPTAVNQEERIALHGLQSLSRSVIAFAERYGWSDTAPPENVIERVVEGRLVDDPKRVVHPEAIQRVYQAMRRRGLVDMFTERAREEIMAEELGSDKTYRLSSTLETLRADIDDELRQKIDDSMAERGRRIQERIRREREAAPDGS